MRVGAVSYTHLQVTLNVPAAAKTLYVQYETENGLSAMQELPLLEGVVSYRVPADSKEYIAGVTAIPGSTDEKPNADRKDNVIYYPANGWGTLMFEDLWPEYGDYDLNDLVANFKVQLYIDKKNKVCLLYTSKFGLSAVISGQIVTVFVR